MPKQTLTCHACTYRTIHDDSPCRISQIRVGNSKIGKLKFSTFDPWQPRHPNSAFMLTNNRERIRKATAPRPSVTEPRLLRIKDTGHIPAFGCQSFVLVPDVENSSASLDRGSSSASTQGFAVNNPFSHGRINKVTNLIIPQWFRLNLNPG